MYYNYVGFYSLVMLVLVDANYRYVLCDLTTVRLIRPPITRTAQDDQCSVYQVRLAGTPTLVSTWRAPWKNSLNLILMTFPRSATGQLGEGMLSQLFLHLMQENTDVPVKVEHHVLVGQGFRLTVRFMRPYSNMGAARDRKKTYFNKKLSSCVFQ